MTVLLNSLLFFVMPLTFMSNPSDSPLFFFFFFFNDTATTEIYTLSLHDALPICRQAGGWRRWRPRRPRAGRHPRSEEHTSELQSPCNLVCRLLLEKKKKNKSRSHDPRSILTLYVHHAFVASISAYIVTIDAMSSD